MTPDSYSVTEYSIDLPTNKPTEKVLALTTWPNGAGCNIQITGQYLQLQLTGACTWEEAEALIELIKHAMAEKLE